MARRNIRINLPTPNAANTPAITSAILPAETHFSSFDSPSSRNNPFVLLFDGLDSEYLIALNIGAVWNVIMLWIHDEMREDPQHIKDTIRL